MSRQTDSHAIDLAIRFGILALFLYSVLVLVRPLIGLVLWAVILCVAVFPIHAWLTRMLGGAARLSAGLLTFAGLAITLGPVALLATGIVEASQIVTAGFKTGSFHVPLPPETIRGWPVIGPQLHALWTGAHGNLESMTSQFGPTLVKTATVLLERAAGVGLGLLTMLLAVLLMGILLIVGPGLLDTARRFADRVFEGNGPALVDMAGATVRNVSRGVIGVAVIQALMAGIVMGAFGIAAAGPLALAVLLLAVIQIGAGPVLIPVVIWAWVTMDTREALLFTVLIAPVTIVDNILKPIFMSRGLQTPMLVIIVGVLGGLIAYGVVGIFIGPVILSVFHRLFAYWIDNKPGADLLLPDQKDL
ncbi:AI-2E family transporter [Tropicimonas sp. IMCC34043]|uniref:AI-2E family transporter n=1 Tax=Tropicimonas sp. IMCC34043 TaxID=2248760 RepID=UPI000E228F50|nr:AI-2E family transporter [Tropicimonas sp. IMCC34043]